MHEELEEGEIPDLGEEEEKEQKRRKSRRSSKKESQRGENGDGGGDPKRRKKARENYNRERSRNTHRREDRKSQSQHHSKDGREPPMPKGNLSAQSVLRLICNAGGSMELGELSASLGASLEQVERFAKEEDGQSLMVRAEKGKQVAVSRSAVRLCALGINKCKGECKKLHLCRYHVFGNCRRSPCKFNHSLQTPQNLQVLQKHRLEALSFTELQQVLLQNDPSLLPAACLHYNHGDGPHGSCTFKNNCNKLHVCLHYLQGTCKFGNKCKRSHDLNEGETLTKLTKWRLNGNLLAGLLQTYINAHALTNATPVSPSKSTPQKTAKQAKPHSQKQAPPDHIEEICLYFILNNCSFRDRCVREHYHLPYRWQVDVSGEWKDFEMMEDVEQSYCDPSSRVTVEGLDFNAMTYKSRKVRRLSTPSFASKPPRFILTTEWLWYWQDEYMIWNEYGKEKDCHKSSTITSMDLENVYLSDSTMSVPFKAGKQGYVLSFEDMVQRNVRFGTERKVCRRPKFVSQEDVKKKKTRKLEPPKDDDKATPPYWDKGDMPDVGYKLIPLAKGSEEYKKIAAAFHRTLDSMTIQSIQRIQNLSLWEVFLWQKEQMKKQNGGKEIKEMQLFHGTKSELVDAICQQNFDWRVCGANGTVYGKGSYFARDSSYSHNYSRQSGSPTQVMFVARVLVGDYTHGKSSYLRPPSKGAPSSSNFYDSCVNEEKNPSIFVIFEKHQIYPEYLIKYSDQPRDLDNLLHVRGRFKFVPKQDSTSSRKNH
ncbi:protein mono-ADP-ribosyltransferase PARP12-like [Pelodytes ibericus]